MGDDVTQSYAPTARVRARRSIATFVLMVLALIACADPPAPAPPTIASFAANPAATAPGSTVTLSWQVAGAASLRLLPDDVDVVGLTQYAVTVDADTTYTLVAANDLGTVSRQVSVVVGPVPSIDAFATSGPAASGGLVNPGLGTTLSWATTGADTVTLRGPGLGDGVDVGAGASYEVGELAAGAEYTLVAANAFGAVEDDLVAARAVPAFSVLVAGQSNAQGVNLSASAANTFITATPFVRMLGNDYAWKAAYEPLDDCVGQLDLVSIDPDRASACTDFAQNISGVSPGVSLGNGIAAATGGTVFLIPGARGGSSASAWAPDPADRYDTGTLFGSAANRSRLAGEAQGAPLGGEWDGSPTGAVLWYQGETDTTSQTAVQNFTARTTTVLDAFDDVFGAPVLLVQLGRRGATPGGCDSDDTSRNLLYQGVRERQRLMEEGARTAGGTASLDARAATHLVVAHDLPMSDCRHLDADAQVELGRRAALAAREHLLGEAVDGTGPRLVAVVKASGTVVRVVADRPITQPALNDASAYGGYFAVFADDAEVPIASIVRDPSDDHAVLITLGESVGAVAVRYMPPPGTITDFVDDVIRSASCAEPQPGTGTCLPMPAFGVATDAPTAAALELYVAPEDDER